jgi:hypothetical protein
MLCGIGVPCPDYSFSCPSGIDPSAHHCPPFSSSSSSSSSGITLYYDFPLQDKESTTGREGKERGREEKEGRAETT